MANHKVKGISKSVTLRGGSQTDRFKEAARKLGCDEDAAAFDKKIKAIVKQKPVESHKPLPEKK